MDTQERVDRLLALDARLLEAAELAVEVAIKKLEDPRTPASAVAAVIGQVFRANGLHENRSRDLNDREPHEMSIDEIKARLHALERPPLIIDATPRSPANQPQATGSVFD